jgi:hypothetical protein
MGKRSDKPKFRDVHGQTRIGKFLREKAPELIDIVGDLTGIDALDRLGDLVVGKKELSESERQLALAYLERDRAELDAVSRRWEADANSDSWLAKNIRPIVLAWYVLTTTTVAIIDSVPGISFAVGEAYIALQKELTIAVVVAYFGSRWHEKQTAIKYR